MRSAHTAWAAPVLMLLAALAPVSGGSAAQPKAATARFTGEVRINEETAVMSFSGEALASEDLMRIDVLQHGLAEEVSMIVSFSEKTLVALYPDTLNGKSYNLDNFDYIDGFGRIRDALLGRQPRAPEGWQQSEDKAVELNGTECIRRQASNADGLNVEWWNRLNGQPLRVEVRKADTQVVIDVTDYESLAQVDPARFAIPPDYTITSAKDDIPEGLPPL